MKFDGKVVLVTGAADGSGKAIARRFLAEGATVVAADLKEIEWDAGAYENRLIRKTMDVSSAASVDANLSTDERTREISILVNNAGIAPEAGLLDTSDELWDKIFAVNAKGTFICSRYVARQMKESGQAGAIINISSIAGRNAFAGASAYCASKAAVIGFTRSLALELGPSGIRVNAVCPGSVDTAMIRGVIHNIAGKTGMSLEATRAMMEESIPLKRFQDPEDVAALVVFLASEDARNINGETINLDGGVVRN